MKKASKVLTLALVVVFLFGIFAGCAMFGTDTERYRAATAINVGDQTVSVGKVLDTFNSLYSSYAQYVNAGYVTIDQLLSSTVSGLYTQYVKLDVYTKTHRAENNSYAAKFANAGYLTAEEMEYVIKNVKYTVYTSFDSSVESLITNKYGTLKAAEKEDSSRAFVKYDKWDGTGTYAQYLYEKNYKNEDMDKYFNDYYPSLNVDADLSDYLLSGAQAQKRVDEYNARIEDEEKGKLTVAEYAKFQDRVLKQYSGNVRASYSMTIEEFISRQIEDSIISHIGIKYDYEITSAIDKDLSTVFAKLTADAAKAKSAQETNYRLNGGFDSFIEGIKDSDYIYAVDDSFDYLFVKNVLIPFSTAQSTTLTNLSNALGGTDNDTYKARREAIAAQIVADNFNSTKNADGEYEKVSGLFKLDSEGKVALNLENSAWSAYFNTDGTIKGENKDQTVNEMMKQFNTDTGSHGKIYNYVVRVGDIPEDYNSGLVEEYFNAAQKLYVGGEAQVGKYVVCVTTYGVHIIYCVGKVEAHAFNFAANYNDTTTAEYRLFKAYYETLSSETLKNGYKTTRDEYYKSKISVTDAFNRFLEDNGLTFDVKASLKTTD